MNRAPTAPSTYCSFRPGHAEIWRWLVRDFRGSDRILDIGCGPGVEAIAFVNAGIDAHYTGVDIAEDAVVLAGGISSIRTQCSFVVASAGNLPFPNEMFRIAAFFLSLHQMEDPVGAIKEAVRVLRAEGVVAILIVEQTDWERAIEYECFPNLKRVEIMKSGRLNVESVRAILDRLGFATTSRRFEYLEQRADESLVNACRNTYFSSLSRLSQSDFTEGLARLEHLVEMGGGIETRHIGCTVLEARRR